MKHVGKMKNNGARLAIIFRTVPGEPDNCLVVGTQGLGDSYHDTLMSLIETDSAQQANELADILAVRKFPDGNVMLGYLHTNGHISKVPTKMVLVTPNSQTSIPLDELNKMIAEQKGTTVEELAGLDPNKTSKENPVKNEYLTQEPKSTSSSKEPESTSGFTLSPAEMRSRADALYKEAARLRKEADAIDPPKTKKKVAAETE